MSDIGMILKQVGAKLIFDVGPKLDGDYSGGHVNMVGILAGMAGDLWDRQADLLVNEIAGIRGLLDAGGIAPAVGEPDSFRITELTAVRNALAGQLIDLQASLEGRGDDASKALNTKIWGHLLKTSAARMPALPETRSSA